jgi:hypothetical protein
MLQQRKLKQIIGSSSLRIFKSAGHDQRNVEVSKGYESIHSGHAYTADEVDAILNDAFDLSSNAQRTV